MIGHRGASGYRPEHTLEAYELAARMGADYIEPDLVTTSDGVLVARHEPEISATTDVAEHPEFAVRRTTKTIDGLTRHGWFAEDFTLAELNTLRAVERLPRLRQENTIYDERYRVPALTDVLALRARLSAELGREIGVYIETKNPSYFASIGLPLEPALVRALREAGLDEPDAPVFLQSFETANLQMLRGQVGVRLVQLIHGVGAPADLVAAEDPRGYLDLASAAGLAEIAEYADGIGPLKDLVIPRSGDGVLGAPSPLVSQAHTAGLLVHPFTFRNENAFLPAQYRSGGPGADYGDAFAEYEAFLRAGVDGMFTDNPDTAVAARSALLAPV
ncbi:glycerophosphoryl diester phosphodiesterase [Pseudonocardia asaccharolytica DSM 44247 = NBRC 16224]|uniref:glycerophosphodiester phosphodiesterase n=1 Tax=Pseudonocardia asaccharolytica DSM 44247 = NBRC 16224 TaxID=1123024 RepID=A0A511D0L6_9PSEU|nr:glycerophosphoryl diester phosphodiesterase [Pseudonocardia asaccharolytica DSM 44247 = NBRC 16224]